MRPATFVPNVLAVTGLTFSVLMAGCGSGTGLGGGSRGGQLFVKSCSSDYISEPEFSRHAGGESVLWPQREMEKRRSPVVYRSPPLPGAGIF